MSAVAKHAEPPEIEHVTQNYFSLRSVILNVTERCGKELANVLRTTESLPSDAAKKEQFLKFVVACRQEYVKLYVLCKWAVVSSEISRSIDVCNWLHGQINCFNNVVGVLFNLQSSLGPAKSPWADLETALQVLNLKEPFATPEAAVYLTEDPLSETEILRLLKRLDVLIALRLALHEQIPLHYRNYEVHNGRARFHLGNGIFWVEFSIADEVVETASRFFYVDCGLDHDSSELDPALRLKIEAAVNQQLATKGFVDVLNWLSHLAATYKLQLLEKQLTYLEQGAGPWASVITHRFSATNLQIRYFIDATDSGEIQVSFDSEAPFDLVVTPPLDIDLNESLDGLADRILGDATRSHAMRLMNTITAPYITTKSDLSVSLELSPYKFTELSIDSTSGKFALAGQGSLILAAQKKLNEGRDPVVVLDDLRAQVFLATIAMRAEAAGWLTRRNIRLSSDELGKIAPHTNLLALRLPNNSFWSLCVALGAPPLANRDGTVTKAPDPRWFACRLTSNQGRWTLQSMNDIKVNLNLADPDYGMFVKLTEDYQRHIALLEVLRELESSNATFGVKQRDGSNVSIIIDTRTVLAKSSEWTHTGLILTGDADNQICLEGRAKDGMLAALGNLVEKSENSVLSVNGETGTYKITTRERQKPLDCLTETLHQLHHTAVALSAAKTLQVTVKSVALKNLELQYAEPLGRIFVKCGQQISFADKNPQKILTPFLPAIVEYTHFHLKETITLLRQTYPICDLTAQLPTRRPELQITVISRSMNQFRIYVGSNFGGPYLEITLRDLRREKMVYFVTAGNLGNDQSAALTGYFKQKSSHGVVPLISGCAVDLDAVNIVESMLEALKTTMQAPA